VADDGGRRQPQHQAQPPSSDTAYDLIASIERSLRSIRRDKSPEAAPLIDELQRAFDQIRGLLRAPRPELARADRPASLAGTREYRRGLIEEKPGQRVWQAQWHFNPKCKHYPTRNFAVRRDRPADAQICGQCEGSA
jgi:hypothetical protein